MGAIDCRRITGRAVIQREVITPHLAISDSDPGHGGRDVPWRNWHGSGIALADAPMMDPVKLSPQYYKVRLDNARVRVLEYHLKPGEKEMMHSHPRGRRLCARRRNVEERFP